MGFDPEARLAYGYDLGNGEPWMLAEASGKWGELVLDWYDPDNADFDEQLMARLYALIPDAPPAEYLHERRKIVAAHWGVEIAGAGHTENSTGVILIAVDTDRCGAFSSYRSVAWSETMALDLDELAAKPARQGWDAKLAAATAALGITPVREVGTAIWPARPATAPTGPKWLVFPYYG